MSDFTQNIVTNAYIKPTEQERVVYSISTGGPYTEQPLVEKIVFRGEEPRCVHYFRGFDESVLKEVRAAQDAAAKGENVAAFQLASLLLVREGAFENLGIAINPRTATGRAPEPAPLNEEAKGALCVKPPAHLDRNLTIGEL